MKFTSPLQPAGLKSISVWTFHPICSPSKWTQRDDRRHINGQEYVIIVHFGLDISLSISKSSLEFPTGARMSRLDVNNMFSNRNQFIEVRTQQKHCGDKTESGGKCTRKILRNYEIHDSRTFIMFGIFLGNLGLCFLFFFFWFLPVVGWASYTSYDTSFCFTLSHLNFVRPGIDSLMSGHLLLSIIISNRFSLEKSGRFLF